ncbi:UNVERIFIED_CONTAM: hypothetical protein GTU68_060728 [Idotea baltica]|nr:hypothetical protein [Idotea baltica]
MVGWLLLGIGSSKLMIQLARLLLGIYAGLGYGSACDFVTEISHHSIRGQLSGLVNFSRQLGFLFVYAVGSTSLTWRQLAFFSGGTTLFVPFIGLLGLPDSPRWLASNQKFDEARKSLVLLRGEIYDVDSEFQLIASNIEKGGEIGSIKQQLKEILNPKVLRRFIFLILVYTLFSINGNCSIVTFTATIFKEAENYLNEYQSTILTGAVRAVGSLLFLVIGDKYSRRRLTQIPLFFMALCMLSLGFYFYWKVDHDVSFIRWIPLSSVMIHQFFVCLTPISFLPCELLPTSTRSMAGSIIWLVSFGSAFVVIFTFPIMQRSIGLHGTFWFYAVNCIVLLLLIISLLPETRGLSLEILNEQVKSPIEKSISDTGSSCIESGTIP